jgi:GTP cyclohydrolase II
VDANRALGYPDDCREYTSVHNILKELGVKSIRLMVREQDACFHAACLYSIHPAPHAVLISLTPKI